MNDRPPQLSPIGAAAEWVSRIVSVGLLMVLPGLGGEWLDRRLGTRFLVLVGFVFGLSAGLYYLLRVTGAVGGGVKKDKHDQPPSQQGPLR